MWVWARALQIPQRASVIMRFRRRCALAWLARVSKIREGRFQQWVGFRRARAWWGCGVCVLGAARPLRRGEEREILVGRLNVKLLCVCPQDEKERRLNRAPNTVSHSLVPIQTTHTGHSKTTRRAFLGRDDRVPGGKRNEAPKNGACKPDPNSLPPYPTPGSPPVQVLPPTYAQPLLNQGAYFTCIHTTGGPAEVEFSHEILLVETHVSKEGVRGRGERARAPGPRVRL